MDQDQLQRCSVTASTAPSLCVRLLYAMPFLRQSVEWSVRAVGQRPTLHAMRICEVTSASLDHEQKPLPAMRRGPRHGDVTRGELPGAQLVTLYACLLPDHSTPLRVTVRAHKITTQTSANPQLHLPQQVQDLG